MEQNGNGNGRYKKLSHALLAVFVIVVAVLVVEWAKFLAAYKADVEANLKEHEALSKALDRISKAQIETTYVLTLSQEKREALNLQMPDSLRNRVVGP